MPSREASCSCGALRVTVDDEPVRVQHFCPTCGATVYFMNDSAPEMVAIPVGAFAGPGFPRPDPLGLGGAPAPVGPAPRRG